MSNFFFKTIFLSFILIIVISIFIPLFFTVPTSISPEYYTQYNIDTSALSISSFGFYWPLPYNHRISSYFGKRTSPTTGASSYHQGIDIPANDGTYIISVMDSEVIATGFKGSGGYSIICTKGDYKISYCHVSPNFMVNVGDKIIAGQVIGQVGPKYVYDVIGNPYKDSKGIPTNGATTGPHLHLTFKVNNRAVNPLDYIDE